MTPKQIDEKLNRTLSAIYRLEDRIEWLIKKVESRRRRMRELGRLRSEILTMKLPIE